MRGKISQRGEGNVGCIFWVLVLGIAILIAWKMVPVKIATAEFYDYIEEQAKFAANTPPEQIEKGILLKAQTLNLPLTKDDVKVERVGDSIRMSASYTVPVKFPGYTYDWHFEHKVDRPIFIF